MAKNSSVLVLQARRYSLPRDYWDPKNRRLEILRTDHPKLASDYTVKRALVSDCTELVVWNYVLQKNTRMCPLYFARESSAFSRRSHRIIVHNARYQFMDGETTEVRRIRFSTLRFHPPLAGVEIDAAKMEELVEEEHWQKSQKRLTRFIYGEGRLDRNRITEGHF